MRGLGPADWVSAEGWSSSCVQRRGRSEIGRCRIRGHPGQGGHGRRSIFHKM